MATRRSRPLIGVTGPNHGGWPAWIFARWAIARVGARAIRITPGRNFEASKLHGLVIGGGADVTEPLTRPLTKPPPPSRVFWPRRVLDLVFAPLVLLVRLIWATKRHGADAPRDAMELHLLEYAREHDLPVLGICRGSQLMNVAEGGTLIRDVQSLYDERPELYTVLPRREVAVEPDSHLHEIVQRTALLVNSLHFHAVRDPGRDMRIVAREPSGVPQAIEHTRRRFWLGVQWHPEYLPQQKSHQRIFEALAEHARAHAEEAAQKVRGAAQHASPREERAS
ncbi:MAG: gamma-glutamyl-gamma-aminobutyrate hydrolase family protein [Polyangiales bacterium]